MITSSTTEDCTLLTLEHGKVNALDVELLGALEQSFRELYSNPPNAVVLTGHGSAFSAGLDLFRLINEGPDYAAALLKVLDDALLAVFEAPFPVVAAINGHAIAGGMVIACACDHRVMAEGKGRVGVPELMVGVPWPTVPLELVRQAFAPNRVQEVVLQGRTYVAAAAFERGIVDSLVPADELISRASAMAREMGTIPREAYNSAKTLLRAETLERIRTLGPGRLDAVETSWSSEETKQVIRDYLDRTVGQKK